MSRTSGVRQASAMARLDLAVWRRTPWAIAAALVPPVGMAVLVLVLTWSVTRQPVALVDLGAGPQAQRMAGIVRSDREAYTLTETTLAQAQRLLARQQVAAVIVIPDGFDQRVAAGRASLDLTLNNVDVDFGDDVRRAVDRSVAEFDAPQLGASLLRTGAAQGLVVPNPYRVDVAEHDLRRTTVTYAKYQTVPVLILLIVNIGVLGGALLGARDHERRTALFLRTAPAAGWSLVAGRLAAMAAAVGLVLAPVVASLAVTHVIDPPAGHWPALVAVLSATALLAAGLGVMLGAAVRRSATVAVVAITVSSYLFFLGGGFTTIAFLPGWLQVLSRAVPTSYAIDAIRQALFYRDLHGVGSDLALLCGFAAAAMVGSVAVLREHAR